MKLKHSTACALLLIASFNSFALPECKAPKDSYCEIVDYKSVIKPCPKGTSTAGPASKDDKFQGQKAFGSMRCVQSRGK